MLSMKKWPKDYNMESMQEFVIVFTYIDDDGDRATATTKPFKAESEDKAVERLIELWEGEFETKIDILKVKVV